MARKGGRRHIKQLKAPHSWNVPRKGKVWTTRPMPGAHPLDKAMPLVTIIKDVLGYADNRREAIKIIKAGDVFVDNKIVRDPKFAVGFMDVISVPKNKENYRALYDSKARLRFQKIDESERGFKLCRIEKKSSLGIGKTQLNLHDGRSQTISSGEYKTGDVVKLALPKQQILEHYTLEQGGLAYVIGGKHAGKTGTIKEIQKGTMTRRPLVMLEKDGETFTTPKEYTFVVGREKPALSIGE
jgi:small subunit ribosomal protein S4e